MTGKKESEPLDELFRKTFQDLPPTPTASGWDTPSPRVWQRVQSQIQPVSTGWSLQTWALLTVTALAVAVGLYFAFGKTRSTPQPLLPTPTEQPTATPNPAVSAPMEATPIVPAGKATDKPNARVKPSVTGTRPSPAVNHSPPRNDDRNQRQAVPLPGSKPAAPNSTEREKGGQ